MMQFALVQESALRLVCTAGADGSLRLHLPAALASAVSRALSAGRKVGVALLSTCLLLRPSFVSSELYRPWDNMREEK